jgi:hypothetical protein
MTVNELIAVLQAIPEPDKQRQIQIWMPGTRISIDGPRAIMMHNGPDGQPLQEWVMVVEGNVTPGSVISS